MARCHHRLSQRTLSSISSAPSFPVAQMPPTSLQPLLTASPCPPSPSECPASSPGPLSHSLPSGRTLNEPTSPPPFVSGIFGPLSATASSPSAAPSAPAQARLSISQAWRAARFSSNSLTADLCSFRRAKPRGTRQRAASGRPLSLLSSIYTNLSRLSSPHSQPGPCHQPWTLPSIPHHRRCDSARVSAVTQLFYHWPGAARAPRLHQP